MTDEASEMDPYEEVAQQGQEAPPSPTYVPDLMKLEHNVSVYASEPVYLEYLVLSDDDIPMEDPEEDPKEDLEEDPIDYAANADDDEDEEEDHSKDERMLRRRMVGESSAVARQPGSTVARRNDYSFVDTVDASIRASESRTMAAIEVVNLRRDRVALRDEVDTLRRYISSLCTTHEQERVEAFHTLDRSEAYNRALEAQIAVLETQAYRYKWQRVADALAERDVDRSRNGDDSHDSGKFEAEAEAKAEAEAEVAPIPPPVPANPEPEAVTVGTGRLTPLKRLFTDTQVWIGSSSSSTAASHDPEDLTPSHIRSDLDALHRRVQHIEEYDVRAANQRLRMMLDCKPPYALPEALLAPVIHDDPRDPYVAARNAATAPATDNDDSPTQKETSPFHLVTLSSLVSLVVSFILIMAPNAMSQAAIERLITQRVNAAMEAERERAPAVRECTFSGFMKCNLTVFHGHEGAYELSRWFEKTKMVFGITECAKARKVKFAATTLQGRDLTWWNSQVATMGLEAANQIGWTEMKRLMTEEFCPIEEI
ncbi:hypothetical protein Tco_0972694 [Tanacetum coccineum]